MKMNRSNLISIILPLSVILLFSACSTQGLVETVLVTTIHTQIAEVPVTVVVTQEVEVTVLIDRPVTITPTHTPLNTPTPSNTPTITPTPTETGTPTATPNLAQTATIEAYGVLASPKSSGFFLVGTDILPGKWHSTGTGSVCYWARLDANQNTLDNHFGLSGGTVNVRATDYEINFEDCGIWEYVENQEKVLKPDANAIKVDGFYTVGVEILAGIWRSTGTGDDCYWARLDGNQNIIDNHFGSAGGSVTIRSTDYEVHFEGCGSWEYQGQ